MRDGNCKHCGKPKEHRERSRCAKCMADYVAKRRALDPEGHKQKERARWAKRSDEQRLRKNASRVKWLDSDPEIRKRHAAAAMEKRKTWTEERRQRQKQTQRDHYERLQLRNSQGLCAYSVKCQEAPIGKQRFCLWHWCKGLTLADLRAKAQFTPDELLALWHSQGGKCAITGVELIPGETAQLDHIHPIARGGSPKIENLRYLHELVNKLKWDKTDSELRLLLQPLLPGLTAWSKITS